MILNFIFLLIFSTDAKNCQDFEIFKGVDYGYYQHHTSIGNWRRVTRGGAGQVYNLLNSQYLASKMEV